MAGIQETLRAVHERCAGALQLQLGSGEFGDQGSSFRVRQDLGSW
jgi:hypothetical protein